VWVVNRHGVIGAALLLRHGMIEVARSKRAGETRQTRMQQLHGYLHSSEFLQHADGILDPLVVLKKALATEKTSHQQAWKKRERQLDQAVRNATEMFSSLDDILEGTLPRISHLDPGAADREQAEEGHIGTPAKNGVELAKSA
jgi:hypothetical protein